MRCRNLFKSALMVKASGQIEQRLEQLQQQTTDLAEELDSLMEDYLKALGRSGNQQLVAAAFNACTQIYPDQFLALTLSQRQQLQQRLKEAAAQIAPALLEKWQTAKRMSPQSAEDEELLVIRQLFLEATASKNAALKREAVGDEPEAPADEGPDSPAEEKPDDSDRENRDQPAKSRALPGNHQALLTEIRTLLDRSGQDDRPEEDSEPSATPLEPAQVVRKQIVIERSIRDVLKAASELANRLLQDAEVMPEIPASLLASAETEGLVPVPTKVPNLMRLSIKLVREREEDAAADSEDDHIAELNLEDEETEVDGPMEDEPAPDAEGAKALELPMVLRLEALPNFVVIHLRLSEIEFADAAVAVRRRRIREKISQLKRLGYAYKQARRDLAIAQAEDAWRASWTSD